MKLSELFEESFKHVTGWGYIVRHNGVPIKFDAPKNVGGFFITIEHDDGHETEEFVQFDERKKIIHFILSMMKEHMDHAVLANKRHLRKFIEICKNNGYNYPEFAAILKSLNAFDPRITESIHTSSINWTLEKVKEFIKAANAESGTLQSHVKFEGRSFIITHNTKAEYWYESPSPIGYSAIRLFRSAGASEGSKVFAANIVKPNGALLSSFVVDPSEYLKEYLSITRTDKQLVIKELLQTYKNMIDSPDDIPWNHQRYFLEALEAARMLGFGGSEIAAIEKSFKASM